MSPPTLDPLPTSTVLTKHTHTHPLSSPLQNTTIQPPSNKHFPSSCCLSYFLLPPPQTWPTFISPPPILTKNIHSDPGVPRRKLIADVADVDAAVLSGQRGKAQCAPFYSGPSGQRPIQPGGQES